MGGISFHVENVPKRMDDTNQSERLPIKQFTETLCSISQNNSLSAGQSAEVEHELEQVQWH